MATYDLEEQEQIAELKAWWKQYGNLVTGLITAAAIAVAAWQGWNWYQRSRSAQASAIYGVLQAALRENDGQRIRTASGELIEKFGSTAYASLGALSAAKSLHDSGDARTARLQLAWVVEHGKDELRDIARLRLVALLIDEKAYDEALKQIEAAPGAAFQARFDDARGDILAAQGKTSEAREAYRSALARLETSDKGSAGKGQSSPRDPQANAAYREVLQLKLEALGEAG